MAKRQTRKSGKKASGIFSYIYKPIHELIGATDNVTRAATNTVRRLVHNSAAGVDTVGSRLTRRADAIVSGIIPRGLKGKKSTSKKSKKSKKSTRRSNRK